MRAGGKFRIQNSGVRIQEFRNKASASPTPFSVGLRPNHSPSLASVTSVRCFPLGESFSHRSSTRPLDLSSLISHCPLDDPKMDLSPTETKRLPERTYPGQVR